MNRNFMDYMKIGSKSSRKFMHQNIRYYLGYVFYTLISLVGKLLGLTYPVFTFSDLRISENIIKENYNFDGFLDDSNETKKIWQVLIFSFIKLILIAIGVIATVYGYFYLSKLGMRMDEILQFDYYYLKLTFEIIIIVIGSVYVLFVLAKLFPGIFLLQQYKNVGLSEAIIDGIKMTDMHFNVKLALIYVGHIMKTILFGGILYLLGFVVLINMNYTIFAIIAIALFILFIFSLPKFVLALNISVFQLLSDTAKAFYLNEQITEGHTSEEMFTREELLSVLFSKLPSTEDTSEAASSVENKGMDS